MDVIYLTGERIQQLHALALEEGGLDGVRSEDALYSSLAMEMFLDLSGYQFDQTDDEIADMFVSLAAGTVDVSEFFGWVVNHAGPVADRQQTPANEE